MQCDVMGEGQFDTNKKDKNLFFRGIEKSSELQWYLNWDARLRSKINGSETCQRFTVGVFEVQKTILMAKT